MRGVKLCVPEGHQVVHMHRALLEGLPRRKVEVPCHLHKKGMKGVDAHICHWNALAPKQHPTGLMPALALQALCEVAIHDAAAQCSTARDIAVYSLTGKPA